MQTFSDFCVEKLTGKFTDGIDVAMGIINQHLTMYYCAETKKPVIVNDFMELGDTVFKKLPPEKKIVVVK